MGGGSLPMPIWHRSPIECADGSYYAGISTEVARRFAQHLAGEGARYCRSPPPVRLLDSAVRARRP